MTALQSRVQHVEARHNEDYRCITNLQAEWEGIKAWRTLAQAMLLDSQVALHFGFFSRDDFLSAKLELGKTRACAATIPNNLDRGKARQLAY